MPATVLTIALRSALESRSLETVATTRNQFAHRVENFAKSIEASADGLTAAQNVDVSKHLLMLEGTGLTDELPGQSQYQRIELRPAQCQRSVDVLGPGELAAV
ncbi:hypothetical protein, partial [Variovorax sp. YR266]|uniref:hypothetical protein n=1 Tax=Variovorax sp. YR266 TaxID=1884386 RepID=UPI00115F7914